MAIPKMIQHAVVKSIIGVVFILSGLPVCAQSTTTIDGKSYTQYKPKYFKPHRGVFYTLYLSPVYTLDPLGLGGKSTYAISVGSRFRIWESYSANDKWSGLKVKGFYTALGYEYYPQQYSKTYVSVWGRVQNFLPLAFKADLIYARGYGLQGLTSRWSIGVEIRDISLFLFGELYKAYSPVFGYHPNTETPYTNAGGFYAIIPIHSRKEK